MKPVPTLLAHIRHVVGLRSEPEMARLDAAAIVARMQNAQAIGNRPKVNLVADAMGSNQEVGVSRSVRGYDPVPGMIVGTSPFPATIGNAHLIPKPLMQGTSNSWHLS